MEESILLVDDEQSVISALKRALMDEPYTIHTANSGVEGLRILKEQKIKVIVSDEMMPGMKGNELLSTVKNLFPETIRIMLTGHASIQAAMQAVNSGEIYRFFAKPWNDVEIQLSIRSALEKYNLEEENKQLLKTVKHQAGELKDIEKKYPGITSIEKDEMGNVVLTDIPDSDKNLSDVISEIVGQTSTDKS